MTEYNICLDCKHQEGTWVNDREVDTWCGIGKSVIILRSYDDWK